MALSGSSTWTGARRPARGVPRSGRAAAGCAGPPACRPRAREAGRRPALGHPLRCFAGHHVRAGLVQPELVRLLRCCYRHRGLPSLLRSSLWAGRVFACELGRGVVVQPLEPPGTGCDRAGGPAQCGWPCSTRVKPPARRASGCGATSTHTVSRPSTVRCTQRMSRHMFACFKHSEYSTTDGG